MAEQTASSGSGGFKRVAIDMLSGLLFLAVFLTTDNIFLATGVGLATGIAQAIWMISRKQKVDLMQWMALALVIGLGGATIVTRNPTFVVFKPSIFESGLGIMMLRPNWMARYSPARSRGLVPPRLIFFWGYLWAAAWFALAASNIFVARSLGLKAWAIYTSFSPFVLLGVLAVLGLLVFPTVVRRQARARGIAISPPNIPA